MDHRRRNPDAGCLGQPFFRENLERNGVENPSAKAVTKHRVGYKFTMAFPLKMIATDLSGIMCCLGLRMWRAITVKQCQKVDKIRVPVTISSGQRALYSKIYGMAWRCERWKWTRVKLIRQFIAQRMIFDAAHIQAPEFFTLTTW